MTLAEMIKLAQAQLQVKAAEKAAIVAKGMDMTPEDVTRGTEIAEEIKALQTKIKLFEDQEKEVAAQAVAVTKAAPTGVTVPDNATIEVTRNAPKGSAVTRVAMVLAKARGDLMLAKNLAESNFKDDALVNQVVKAAVAAGTSQVAAWAGNLIYPEQYAGDFVELLYPQTILGRLALRKVPFNVRISTQNAGTTVGWVGEAQPAPVTSAGFDKIFLTWAKAYGIAVMSEELIRFSNPAAEALVQQDLLKALAKGLDLTFVSNAAAVANVSPAGMLNGVTPIPASGNDALSLIKDVQSMVAPLIAANLDLSTAVLVMSPARALAIASMRNALGAKYFPEMSMDGGTLEGFPAITSNNVSGNTIVLLVQDEIYLSEDAGPQIDITREASLVMDSNPAASSAQPVSMFQNDLVGVRIGQFINWQSRRPGLQAAAISGAAYGS